MKCIFICVFNNENYVKMAFLLLESIHIYGNLDSDTDILIYTSTKFMNMFKASRFYNSKVFFEINDTFNTVRLACRSRYNFFKLESARKYSKVLYIDTDVLIKNNISKVFDVVKKDILYVVEEGRINDYTRCNVGPSMCVGDYYGCTLFGRDINKYNDKTAFTSGILLFNNCENIKKLFDDTIFLFNNSPVNFKLNDQPFLVYNAFKSNLYNNKILKTLCTNMDNENCNNTVIHHFPGTPGLHTRKIVHMTNMLNHMKRKSLNTNLKKNTNFFPHSVVIPIIKQTQMASPALFNSTKSMFSLYNNIQTCNDINEK
jgi:lipopolysaccharide biosynthesis glycosyltransferase